MKTLNDISQHFSIPVVDAHASNVEDIQSFLHYVKGLKGLEGFVITFENGHRVKCKAEEYVLLHKTRDAMSFEKDVWALVLDEKVDDLLPLLSEDDQNLLTKFASNLNTAILNKAGELSKLVNDWIDKFGSDQKKFAVEFVNSSTNKFTSDEKGLLFKIKAGKDPISVVRDYVRSHCTTSTTIDEVRPFVGGLKWGYDSKLEDE